MPNTWFTSDEHYWHARVREMSDRPFDSDEEMALEMIRRHNKVVRDGDTTFHLGDFWFGPRDDGRMAETVAALNGRHVLVAGNHDRCSVTAKNGWAHQRTYLNAGFEAVVDSAKFTLPSVAASNSATGVAVGPREVLLSHFPYHADHTDKARYTQHRLRDEGMWLVHGHVHGAYMVRDRGVNVGVDRWGYRPVSAHDVAALIVAHDQD